MSDFSGLQSFAQLFDRLEEGLEQAKLTVLSRDHYEQISKEMLEGLANINLREDKIRVETRTGEYLNEIATLETGKNKYTIALDREGVYISELNGFACRVTPDAHGLLVFHQDSPGIVHEVSKTLAERNMNIYSMNLSREQKGKNALLVLLTDESVAPSVVSSIEKLPKIDQVFCIQS